MNDVQTPQNHLFSTENPLPVLCSVAHAIANATGIWIKDLPITPEKILKAQKE